MKRKAGLPVQLRFAGEFYPAILIAASRNGCRIDLGRVAVEPGGRCLIKLNRLVTVPVTVRSVETPYAVLEVASPLLASVLMYALADCTDVALQHAEWFAAGSRRLVKNGPDPEMGRPARRHNQQAS